MSIFSKLLRSETQNWVFAKLQPSQIPGNPSSEQFEEDECYLEIWMKSMRVKHNRKGFNTFYPVLYGFSSFDLFGIGNTEFNSVINPTNLQTLDKKSEKIIQANLPMLGPVPYTGGNISFEAGLFSVKERDLSKPFLGLIESISDMAGISFVTQALTFADPIKKGIDALAGAGADVGLEVGLNTTFRDDTLATDHFAVLGMARTKVDVSKLKLHPNTFVLIKSDGKDFNECPYFIFELRKTVKKANWADNKDFKKAFDKIKEAQKKGDKPEIKDAFDHFKRIISLSGDLISKDAQRIINKVAKLIANALSTDRGPGFESRDSVLLDKNFHDVKLNDIKIY